MATYVIMDLAFIALVMACFRITPRLRDASWLVSLAGLLVLTVVFDNLMIALGFFIYNPEKILGLYIGLAPIEDLMYPVFAMIIVPHVWRMMDKEREQ